jgi:hypothetical protein
MSSVALSNTDLILAALLLAINGGISVAFGLRLELNLLLATVRMAVQVAAIGFVLKFVFAQSSPLWTAAVAMLMLLLAGYELMARQERRFKGWWTYGLGNATLLFRKRLGHALRCYRRDCATPMVRAALSAAHPRHGARQHTDQRKPGAANLGRGDRA